MARISFRQVEAFRAVMIAGTTTGAAEILYISQPAVSRLLSDFEESVGVQLFERQKKRLIPTPEATILFEEVEKSFVGMEKLARTAEELKVFHRGTLRIVCMPALAQDFLPGVVSEFMADHEGVAITLQVRSSQQVADWIANQHFDIGISAIKVSDPAIEVRSLASSSLLCVLPPAHRLADKALILPEDLEGEQFVSLGTEQSVRYKVDEVFDKAGVQRKLLFDTQVSHVACAYVLAGGGVSLVDPATAIHYAKLGLIVKPFEPAITFNYNILYPVTRSQSQLGKEFTQLLRQRLKQLSDSSDGLFQIDA
ncbi:LysR substrate-binding domain-containing protein [Aestuariirhabdus litorea]|uniref:LysR family transcriptional regulator n=1 Tax=Aestuariirhabdus litorea TaxID=2528527 RepID=A0A3P3VMI4_9GAMM|nr:LysR substrate-binding domain-containing protein [Aestuariirhabdus litorea]RRJ82866.1 LysR family transcriptional regulator [Aestuariirhabdus litorea]RWW93025.1 LysR family transcriptional regulator [Endozoicomonadaceae bacterium GTF-13]